MDIICSMVVVWSSSFYRTRTLSWEGTDDPQIFVIWHDQELSFIFFLFRYLYIKKNKKKHEKEKEYNSIQPLTKWRKTWSRHMKYRARERRSQSGIDKEFGEFLGYMLGSQLQDLDECLSVWIPYVDAKLIFYCRIEIDQSVMSHSSFKDSRFTWISNYRCLMEGFVIVCVWFQLIFWV